MIEYDLLSGKDLSHVVNDFEEQVQNFWPEAQS
jgi:hypothetical protein